MSDVPTGDPSAAEAVRPPLLERLGISPVLFAFLSLFLIFILFQIVGGVITVLVYGLKPTEANIAGYRLSNGIGQIVFLLVPTLILLRFASLRPGEFVRFRAPGAAALFIPLVGIFSLQQMLQVYMVFQERIPLPPDLERQLDELKRIIEETYKLLVTSGSIPELLWVIIIIALIPAISEELLFRGLVQRSLQKSMTPLRAAVATGIIFGAYHLNPSSFIPLSVIGIYLGFVALRADSLWVSIVAHFYNNVIASVSLFLHISDDYVVTGNAEKMSNGMLLLTFWLFGVVFLVSLYYFLHVTKEGSRPEQEIHEPA